MYQCIYDDICMCLNTYLHIYTLRVWVCALQLSQHASVRWCPVAGLDENALRDTFRVEFIAPDGSVESGVDGGGLFKARRRCDHDPGNSTMNVDDWLVVSNIEWDI